MSSAEQLASVTPLPGAINTLPPLAENTQLASTLPEYDLYLDDVRPGKRHSFDGGEHVDYQYRFNDGTKYIGRLTLPNCVNYDVMVSHRLPWCTDLEGMYTAVDEEHARRGSISFRASPQKAHVFKAIKNIRDSFRADNDMLAHDAYAHNVMLDHIDTLDIAEPDHVIETNDSKAAMNNLAMQAYAPQFGRLVVYSHDNDICLHHALGSEDFTPEAIARNTKYLLIDEPKELARAITTHPRDEMRRLAKTASPWPGFWAQQVATGVALFRGRTGGYVDHIPAESRTSLRFFRRSEFNHAMDWLISLARFKGIYVYMEDGSHLSLADWDVQLNTIDIATEAQDQLKNGTLPHELNSEQIVTDVNRRQLSPGFGKSNRAAQRPVQTVS